MQKFEEDASLLNPGKRQSTGLPSRQQLTDLTGGIEIPNHIPNQVYEVLEHPKTRWAIVICVFVFWYQGWFPWSGSSGSSFSSRAAIGSPRGLENGAELQWAQDAFGVFLKPAVPALEKANFDCHNFLNLLPEGKCDAWTSVLADQGVFSFNLPHLQAEFSTREEVRRNFCLDTARIIKAMKLVWHFPDMERLTGLAVFEVFTQAFPGAEMKKERWAQYAAITLKGGVHITEYRLYVESQDEGNLKGPVDAAVQANLQRLNGHDCRGFEAALPASGTENWIIQSMPTGSGKKDELDELPRDQLMAKCRKDSESDWKNIDFQYATVEATFPSARDSEVMVFFHKEKRYKGTIDVTDDPEALLIKLAPPQQATFGSAPVVHSLVFFIIEGVHLVQEWGWKYGWASSQR